MNRRTVLFPLLILSLLVSACGASGEFAHAGQTPTPTPFLPNFGGEVPEEEEVVVIDGDPGPANVGTFAPPSAASDVAVPEPLGSLAQPEGQINILLMGSDQRPNDGGFRTDVNLLLTLNFEGQSVSLTSFPRDLYIYQPGWRVDRINGAQARGGFELSSQTMEYNFGVHPDHYVLINFAGFVSLIDALGGITVNVGEGLTDEREGPGDFSVPAGNVAMDGETALWYVRSRGTSSDFARTRRQQEVLIGIFFRLLSLDAITRAPELYEQYKQTVITDLGITDVLPWLPLAASVNGNGQIHRYAIGADNVDSFTTSSGGAVLIPQREDVITIMKQALSSPE
jgi:polyisoprenyl-teichoic acid--peptidoglycan teichoic acid transferase